MILDRQPQAVEISVIDPGDGSFCLSENFTIPARDGVELSVSGYTPEGQVEQTVILVCGTVATPRQQYADFGCFMARQGYPTITFDYRGIGESLDGSVEASTASLSDWGRFDLAAVLDWINEKFPGFKIVLVGHGFGGQLPALIDNGRLIDGLITFSAAAYSYHNYEKLRGRRRFYLGTRYLLPAMISRLGYVPTHKMRFAVDTPQNVFLEWSRWCQEPDYLFSDPALNAKKRAAELSCPVLATIVEDDMTAPEAAVRALHEHYINAGITYWPLKATDFDLNRLGHFGPFGKKVRDRLWLGLAEWIDQL